MTPFGIYLRVLRARKNITLKELAEHLGLNPSYLSMLEHGKKGKPSSQLISDVTNYFSLSKEQAVMLRSAASNSESTIKIPSQASPGEYELVHEIIKRLHHLSEEQRNTIRQVIGMQEEMRLLQ